MLDKVNPYLHRGLALSESKSRALNYKYDFLSLDGGCGGIFFSLPKYVWKIWLDGALNMMAIQKIHEVSGALVKFK